MIDARLRKLEDVISSELANMFWAIQHLKNELNKNEYYTLEEILPVINQKLNQLQLNIL